MEESEPLRRSEELLRILVQLNARLAVPEEMVRKSVGTSARLVKAYNLSDGTRSQSEIAKAAKLDSGNFSRTVARWVQEGVLFKLGTGREAKLLHVYPLS